MGRLTRDGTAEPVSRDQILRHARGQGNIIFSVQLTTSRIGNLTRLIHTLLYVMTIHTWLHRGVSPADVPTSIYSAMPKYSCPSHPKEISRIDRSSVVILKHNSIFDCFSRRELLRALINVIVINVPKTSSKQCLQETRSNACTALFSKIKKVYRPIYQRPSRSILASRLCSSAQKFKDVCGLTSS